MQGVGAMSAACKSSCPLLAPFQSLIGRLAGGSTNAAGACALPSIMTG